MKLRLPRSILTETLRMAIDSLRGHKFRSFLTVLGIVIGVLTAILIASIITGMRQSIIGMIEEYGTNNIYAFHLSTGPRTGEDRSERTRKPLTADAIAAELETSKRTIYRDIATLIEQRVPIRGEAGMGYILEKGFDLPPLMLTPDEIEAAVLGAQWVATHADPVLARAAQDLMAKIAETVPERLRPFVLEPASRARPVWNREPDRIDMVRTRTQIHEGKKITLSYRDEHGRPSERTIWPIAVGYHEAVRILAAWCELRKDFRSFRTDRVVDAIYHDEKYPERRDLLRAKWRRSLVWEAPKDT